MGNSGFFKFRRIGQLESEGLVKGNRTGLGVQVKSMVTCLGRRLDDSFHKERSNPVTSPLFENSNAPDSNALVVRHPAGSPEWLVLTIHREEVKCDPVLLVDLDFFGDILLHDEDPVSDRKQSIRLLRPCRFDDRNFRVHVAMMEIESAGNCKSLGKGAVDSTSGAHSARGPAIGETPTGINHPDGYLPKWLDWA